MPVFLPKLAALISVVFCLITPLAAQTLETNFFTAQVPHGWNVSRDTSGLWTLSSSQPFLQESTLLVNPLPESLDLYFGATSRIWATKGPVEFVAGPEQFGTDQALFYISPKDQPEQLICKLLKWDQQRILVLSSTFPVKHYEKGLENILRFTGNIQLSQGLYEENALRTYVQENMVTHSNSRDELGDLVSIRHEMTVFRQDWEAYFPKEPSQLFTAYREYLEARYDAAFVLAHGAEMGMPPDLFNTRLSAVEGRRLQVLRIFNSEGSAF